VANPPAANLAYPSPGEIMDMKQQPVEKITVLTKPGCKKQNEFKVIK
jgi:hypothetical protein